MMQQIQVYSIDAFDATVSPPVQMNIENEHIEKEAGTFSMTDSDSLEENHVFEDVSLSDEGPVARTLPHSSESPPTLTNGKEKAVIFPLFSRNSVMQAFGGTSKRNTDNSSETERQPENAHSDSDPTQPAQPAGIRHDEGFQQLCSHIHTIRSNPNKATTFNIAIANAPLTVVDTDLALRLEAFYQARTLRRYKYKEAPDGIFGLFSHLGDLRLDLEWAQDSVWRRTLGEPYFSWVDFEHLYCNKYHFCAFTYTIMVVSTVMMLIAMWMNDWNFASAKVNPMFGPDPSVLIDLGALTTVNIVEQNEWYRLVAPIVLHAGIIHYVINMAAIWLLGGAVERVHGSIETGVVFLLSGVGGNLASANFMPYSVSVGASGGIFGLLGLCLTDIFSNWELMAVTDYFGRGRFPYLRVSIWLFFELVINMCVGWTPYVDNFAHLGGLFYGICFGLICSKRLGGSGFFGQRSKARHYRRFAVAFIGAGLAITLLTVTTLLLVESDGRTRVCPGCRYLSCVPFPFWKENRWWYCDSCDMSAAELFRFQGTTELELTCPNGAVVTIDLMDPDPDRDAVRSQLPGFCRQHCKY
jgi:membrane associated rhomboid family serine protease